MFGDWNDDGHVDPAEAWATLYVTGVLEDGDTESTDELGDESIGFTPRSESFLSRSCLFKGRWIGHTVKSK